MTASIRDGLRQKEACNIMQISPKKFRRWRTPKLLTPRTAWNKILPQERENVIQTAVSTEFLGKPISHLFVHGHEKSLFSMSISSIYHILKSESLERNIPRKRRKMAYTGVPELLEQGFSLLCYDGSYFMTDTGQKVWAIPVMLLPCRYLLHIGHCLTGVTSRDLIRSIDEAYLSIPEEIKNVLIAHSDRGSAMKSDYTKKHLKEVLNLPIHYGRPHTPDDMAWIEVLIKAIKYHREAPLHYGQVKDVTDWLDRVDTIYNNEPHSSLSYVTPRQALLGQKEVILEQRKKNILETRKKRLEYYYECRVSLSGSLV